MEIKVDYFRENFKEVGSLANFFSNEEEVKPPLLGESSQGVLKKQVIPFIYLERTSNISFNGGVKSNKVTFTETSETIKDVIAFPGYGLKMLSFSKRIILGFELFNDLLYDYYSPKKSLYYFFLSIEREDIISFAKIGTIKFYGVNPKNSVEMKHDIRRGTRGILAKAVVSGITKLASSIEDDLKLRDGILYELVYLKSNEETKLNIICELPYSNNFDKFLSNNWNIIAPEPKVIPPNKGCFIATATMGNYNHPVVVDLRKFRDGWLSKQRWGIGFIEWYYEHSPKAAKVIEKSSLLRSISYFTIVKPLQIITKKLR